MARLSLCLIAAAGCASAADPVVDDFPDAAGTDTRPLAHVDAPPHIDADADDVEATDAALPDAEPCTGGDTAALDPATGHCYRLFTGDADWNAAEGACHTGFGHLVTITSETENSFVQALVGSRQVWMGATDATAEGVWTWNTGEPFTFSTWDSGQPDNGSGTEDCALMRGGSGRWNDDQCGNDREYVCERD